MENGLLVLPILIPLFTAVACAFLFRWRSLVSIASVLGSSISLVYAAIIFHSVVSNGIQVTAFGSWPAPFGIVFVADILAASLILITAIIALAMSIYFIADLRKRNAYALYQSIAQVLLAAVSGSFLTGDIFNLYVWFEVMLISAFGLMVIEAEKPQVDAAVKYVVLNLISTLVLLLAIGLLYGATGSLNLADLHEKMQAVPQSLQTLIAGLFFFGFAIKAGFFPVFAWLPASYPYLPASIAALFAALLTKVGMYAMIRLFTLVFNVETSGYQDLMIIIAGLTMLTGVLGAATQFHIKRILSFHIISQIGYMLMGLAIFTPLAIAGAVFYIIHHIIVKANLFLVSGYLERRFGTDDLAKMGGMYQSMPYLALIFFIPAFSLAGFPPLSGFWGKFIVIKASFLEQHYLLAATALFVGLMTIYSMTKIWAEAFWKQSPENTVITQIPFHDKLLYCLPITALSLVTIFIGLAVEPVYQIALQASENLLTPDVYIQAVLETNASFHFEEMQTISGGEDQ